MDRREARERESFKFKASRAVYIRLYHQYVLLLRLFYSCGCVSIRRDLHLRKLKMLIALSVYCDKWHILYSNILTTPQVSIQIFKMPLPETFNSLEKEKLCT